MTKCVICNRYVEAPELMNEQVCSAICLGKKYERKRILKLIEERIEILQIGISKFPKNSDEYKSAIDVLEELKRPLSEGERSGN